jgi:hypothetical protein
MLVKLGRGSNEGGLRKPVTLSYSITTSIFTMNVGYCVRKRGRSVTSYQNW